MVSVRKKARICHSPRRHERLSLSVLLVVVRIKGSFNYVSNGQSHPSFNPLVAIAQVCVLPLLAITIPLSEPLRYNKRYYHYNISRIATKRVQRGAGASSRTSWKSRGIASNIRNPSGREPRGQHTTTSQSTRVRVLLLHQGEGNRKERKTINTDVRRDVS